MRDIIALRRNRKEHHVTVIFEDVRIRVQSKRTDIEWYLYLYATCSEYFARFNHSKFIAVYIYGWIFLKLNIV